MGEKGSGAGKMGKVFESRGKGRGTEAKVFPWESLRVPITRSLELLPEALGNGVGGQ